MAGHQLVAHIVYRQRGLSISTSGIAHAIGIFSGKDIDVILYGRLDFQDPAVEFRRGRHYTFFL